MSDQDTSTTNEVVDTSTNEETQDTESQLEESDVSFDDFEDDSEEDETEESEESEEDESANESTDETEEESEEDADQEQESPAVSENDQKRHNDEMAKKRIAEREAREKAKRDAQDEYINEATDPHEIALRQLQVDAYNNRIQMNTNSLQNAIDKSTAHIDLFKTGTPEVKEALYEAADDFERMFVVRDKNGDPVEINGDLFEYLQNKAETIRKLTGAGARENKQAKEQAKARTMPTPTRAPKKPKGDPDLEGFDEEASRW